MVANETSGNGGRGLFEYIVFEKKDVEDAANETFFQLENPIEKDPHGRRIELPRIVNDQPGFAGPAPGKTSKSIASLRRLSGGGLVHIESQPALFLQADARRELEHGGANRPPGLRRPGDRRQGEGGQKSARLKPKKQQKIRGEFIAGTLHGTPREMAAQSAPFRAVRPDIKAPVMHYSLSFEAGDGRKTPEEWKPIIESFLTKMGVPLSSAWTSFLHNDTGHQHAHIAFLRSFGDGEIWNREFSARRAIAATAEIEKEFGLLQHDRTPNRDKKRLTRNEKELEKTLNKEGKTMSKITITNAIDEFINSRQGQQFSVEELRQGLAQAGVEVVATERGGEVTGIKFQNEGVWISGSGLGDDYKAHGLLGRGLVNAAAPVPVPHEPDTVKAESAPAAAQPAAVEGVLTPRAAAMAQHNAALNSAAELFQAAMRLLGVEMLIRLLVRLFNMLLGRKEVQHGAPAQSLGRIDEKTLQARPGRVPKESEPGHKETLSAMADTKAAMQEVAKNVKEKRWGELLEHGPAPYQFKDGAGQSYFAKLRVGDAETILWGVGIADALASVNAKDGDVLSLERAGREAVTITERLPDGTVKEKQAHRNAWAAEVKPDALAALGIVPTESPAPMAAAAPLPQPAKPKPEIKKVEVPVPELYDRDGSRLGPRAVVSTLAGQVAAAKDKTWMERERLQSQLEAAQEDLKRWLGDAPARTAAERDRERQQEHEDQENRASDRERPRG